MSHASRSYVDLYESIRLKLSDAAVSDIVRRATIALGSPSSPASERACLDLLAIVPDHAEALNYVAVASLARGELLGAITFLDRAVNADPMLEAARYNLAQALATIGNFEAAKLQLEQLIKQSPKLFEAKLLLADVYFEIGDEYRALAHYFNGINLAQGLGFWREENAIPADRRGKVLGIMRYVAQGRRRLFAQSMDTLREAFGPAALARVERGLAIYLLDEAADYPDPDQRPSFFYLPGMPASRFLERNLFRWTEEFEAQTTIIRDEVLSAIELHAHVEPVHRTASAAELKGLLFNASAEPRWDGIFFYRHGNRFEEVHRSYPETSAALAKLPLVHIRDHAPEVMFSVLTPGTHIRPHGGVTNTRIVTHLPLIVPEHCALSVAGQIHEWKEGKCMMFDDTYQHEAWNRGQSHRILLICDVWNPHMTEVECEAVRMLVEVIGDFNQTGSN